MEDSDSKLAVELRDPAGAPLPVDAALLVPDSGEPAIELGAAGSEPAQPWTAALARLGPGPCQLRVEPRGRPPLCLRLHARLDDVRVVLRFAGSPPRCCELGREADECTTTLTVNLGERHEELIFVAGWDYSGGANNLRWCETWRDDLYAGQTLLTGEPRELPRRIHDHTVVTLFDFETGERVQQLRAADGWHEIDRALQGTVRTHLGPYRDPAHTARRHDDDSISIVHVYDHIAALGRTSPGSLAEFHVFSHAWAGGPILVNTDQSPRYAYSRERDPSDKDGRCKDFLPVNMPALEQFAAAFAPGAIAKIWGCYATTLYRRMVRAAARAQDRERPLRIRAGDELRRMSAAEIEAEFRERIIGESYMARLGRAAGIRVYGAPPGMGANLRRVGGRYFMFVRPRVYALEYRWYAEALGLEPDISGHFAYTSPIAALERRPV